MDHLVNSFPLRVPEIEATVYSIDPQPHSDTFSQLGYLERVVEWEVSGRAQKWTQPGDDNWYIAVVGEADRQQIERNGTTLTRAARDVLDPARHWDRMVLQRALQDSLKSFLKHVHGFWFHDRSNAVFYDSPRGELGGYDVFTGFESRVAFHDEPQLVVDTKTKFLGESLMEIIEDVGEDEAERQYGGKNFLYDSPEKSNCQLHGIARGKTIEEKTFEDRNGDLKSVYEYVKENYDDEAVEKVSSDEPLVQIRYGDSDPHGAAPSLLRPSPRKLDRELSNEAALTAKERRKATMDFARRVNYIEIENQKVRVGDSLLDPPQQGEFDYPGLVVGGDRVVRVGDQNELRSSQQIHPGNYGWVIKDYLEEFGFWRTPRKPQEIAVVHPGLSESVAEMFYSEIRGELNRFGGPNLSVETYPVDYRDENEFDRWVSEYADDIDGVLGILQGSNELYYELIDWFNGLPSQFVDIANISNEGRVDDEKLFNASIGFGVKLGGVPFKLQDRLSHDVYMGYSVTGDESTTATAVMMDSVGDGLLFQTEEGFNQGSSSVADEFDFSRILKSGLETATNELDQRINSLTVHKNGQFGDEEVDALWDVFSSYQERGLLSEDFEWEAVEVLDNHPYRIFKENDDACFTGGYTVLDDDNILVTTWGEPYLHQGTPDPLRCRRKTGTENLVMRDIGQDVFALSFLGWGAPAAKMKPPLTTKLPAKLSEILERCNRVRYPPF